MDDTKARQSGPDLGAWLARYKAAWECKDPSAAAELFAADALYHETPFAEPFRGRAGIRDYWANVTADQRDIDFRFDVVGIAGSTGIARWNAKLTSISSGARVELDGAFLLEFDEQGLCTMLREWWHAR
jgi:ketosteroid isomerase-like protein